MTKSNRGLGGHYLRKNHGNYTPQTWVFVDTLSTGAPDPSCDRRELHRLAYGAAQYCRFDGGKPTRMSRCFLSEPQQFWTWLLPFIHERRSLWICGHGIAASMTFLHFWDMVDSGVFELRRRAPTVQGGDTQTERVAYTDDYLMITKDVPTIVMASADGHLVHIVDTRNYLDATVADLAEWSGTAQPQKPLKGAPAAHWENYLRARVRATAAAMGKLTKWWKDNDMGVWRYTASSLAMAAFKHRHYRQPIVIDDCQDARDLSREALAGGECRCFWIGQTLPWIECNARIKETKGKKCRFREGPIYLYDANSLYPAVMRENLFPRELIAWKQQGSFDDLVAWSKTLCLVARVHLNSWEIPWPVKDRDGERWFAVGNYSTVLAGPELLDALGRGLIRHVHEIAAYMPGRLFTTYVDEFYPRKQAARRDGNKLEAEFYKVLLNNLAGKFAQRTGGWEWSDLPSPGVRWGPFVRTVNGKADPSVYRCIAGYVQQQSDLVDSLESLPAVTAFVNSYARMYMRSVRRAIGEEHIIYQDTDSLHLTEDGRNRLIAKGYVSDDQLGKFSLRLTIERGTYRGVKNYTADNAHCVAGRKLQAIQLNARHYVQVETESLDSIIGRQPQGIVAVERVTKSLADLNARGIVANNGYVSPANCLEGVIHLKRDTRSGN